MCDRTGTCNYTRIILKNTDVCNMDQTPTMNVKKNMEVFTSIKCENMRIIATKYANFCDVVNVN